MSLSPFKHLLWRNMSFTAKLGVLLLPGLVAFLALAGWGVYRNAAVAEVDQNLERLTELRADALELGFMSQRYSWAVAHSIKEAAAINHRFMARSLDDIRAIRPWLDSAYPFLTRDLNDLADQTRRVLKAEPIAGMGVEEESQLLTDMVHDFNKKLATQSELQLTLKEEAHQRFDTWTYILLVIGILLLGSVILVMRRVVVTPIHRAISLAKLIASGNLAQNLDETSHDEFGELGHCLNTMAASLRSSQDKLKEISIRDFLTGLYNVREFNRLLTEEMVRERRYGRQNALLMLDIDHFKQINDTHGHLAGDEVLRSLGSRIRDHIRPSDHAARYGGEEFAIILTETPYKSALVAAEQLRRHICSEPFTIGGGMSLDVTVSIGVAGYPEHGNTEVALVKSADDALYKAKNSGRNQVCGAAGLNASDIHQAPANG